MKKMYNYFTISQIGKNDISLAFSLVHAVCLVTQIEAFTEHISSHIRRDLRACLAPARCRNELSRLSRRDKEMASIAHFGIVSYFDQLHECSLWLETFAH
mmetsp:Transcript_25263/g.53634  ORF Transcript_25263/g.53634 Transcript_25263/m.53634 type:complete len:100 (-) Transcript_25263:47-346(-)